jgi:hypothetical protein
MVGTIGPAVRGAGKPTKLGIGAFSAGSVVGGAAAGLVVAMITLPLDARFLEIVLVATALFAAASYLRSGKVSIPWPRQAPPGWIKERTPIAGSARYGLVMGAGFATPVRAASLLALAAVAGSLHDPVTTVLLFALMGGFRALPVAVASALQPGREGSTQTAAALSRLYLPAKAVDVAAVVAAVALLA